MSDPQHEHGSGVAPAAGYAPGVHALNPSGLSKGIAQVPATVVIPPAPEERTKDRHRREAEEAKPPYDPRGRLGKPMPPGPTEDMLRATRTRPRKPPPRPSPEMFDDPPDVA